MSRTGLSVLSSIKSPLQIKGPYFRLRIQSAGRFSIENTRRPLESIIEFGS